MRRLARAARGQRRNGAQNVGDEIELDRAAAVDARFQLLAARQRRHGVDLAEQLVSGFFELDEIRAQRMFAIGFHILDQTARYSP